MADENTPAEEVKTPPAQGSANPPPSDGDVQTVPYARFKEVNDALKETTARISQIEADQKKAREAELAEQGKFKELLETATAERESYKVEAESWKAYQADRRKTLTEQLPEADRDIYGELRLDKLEAHVDRVKESKNKAPGASAARPSGENLGYKTPQEAAFARGRGDITEADFQKVLSFFKSQTPGFQPHPS